MKKRSARAKPISKAFIKRPALIQLWQVLSESAAVLRSRRQVVTMLVAVVFFFFACIMPFKVLTLWIVTSPSEVFEVVSQETYFNLVST